MTKLLSDTGIALLSTLLLVLLLTPVWSVETGIAWGVVFVAGPLVCFAASYLLIRQLHHHYDSEESPKQLS